ncbi:hypothetical protein [Solibacillus faecavium]|nr:hypothetical protein [Solibacillus faecavium]
MTEGGTILKVVYRNSIMSQLLTEPVSTLHYMYFLKEYFGFTWSGGHDILIRTLNHRYKAF